MAKTRPKMAKMKCHLGQIPVTFERERERERDIYTHLEKHLLAKTRRRTAKRRPKMAKMRSKLPKMRPKMAKMRPKMAKMRPQDGQDEAQEGQDEPLGASCNALLKSLAMR